VAKFRIRGSVRALSASPRRLIAWFGRHRAELRLGVRVAVGGLLAFGVAHGIGLAQGYWAVFTAIIVMQASVGGSLSAALDYFVGTLGGAIYGVIVALIIPIDRLDTLALALAVSLGPLAFLAALRPSFRVAPITAAIILIIPGTQQTGIWDPAIGRVIEIAIGSVSGVLVSLFVLPTRAHRVVAETASDILTLMARLTPVLKAGFRGQHNRKGIVSLQDRIRRGLIRLDAAVREAERERANHFSRAASPEPLIRTLRRLRLDLAMVVRTAGPAWPQPIREKLAPPLGHVGDAVRGFLLASALSLRHDRHPPAVDKIVAAVADYAAAMSELRRAGLTRELSDAETARIFTLGFALDQLRRNLEDLGARLEEFARSS
jgi:uncharacterized membrane protein YccC